MLNGIPGSIAYDVRIWLSRIGGLVIISFGLYMPGLLNLEWLQAKPAQERSNALGAG